MKAKKTAPPRRRISFAVDRDEIEINSDWVDAVMTSPAATQRGAVPSTVVSFPAPAGTVQGPFFVPERNNATGAENASGADCSTGEECTSVEQSSAVDKLAPVAEISAVEENVTVVNNATVVKPAGQPEETVSNQHRPKPRSPGIGETTVVNNATVVNSSTGKDNFTDKLLISTKDHRVPRPRSIVRVTDGLTPGQYAVYSLMYEAGEGTGGSSRIYRGGYADLGRLTGLSKRGIQNIVAELQTKYVISIHQQPGYHRTETSAYLVPDSGTVLQLWFSKGWRRALGKSKTLIS